jgi:hypothetical protein
MKKLLLVVCVVFCGCSGTAERSLPTEKDKPIEYTLRELGYWQINLEHHECKRYPTAVYVSYEKIDSDTADLMDADLNHDLGFGPETVEGIIVKHSNSRAAAEFASTEPGTWLVYNNCAMTGSKRLLEDVDEIIRELQKAAASHDSAYFLKNKNTRYRK